MPKMSLTPRTRILAALATFFGVVIALAILYSLVGMNLVGQSPNKWMLALLVLRRFHCDFSLHSVLIFNLPQ